MPDELSEPDGAPIRTRLLNENLVAFRDSSGNIGVVEAFCPHRRAPMFFARNVCDRTREHLGTDIAIINARRRLLKATRDLQQGTEPFGAARGDLYRVRSMDLVSPVPELAQLLQQHGDQALAPAYT
jgi:hypothetical protein